MNRNILVGIIALMVIGLPLAGPVVASDTVQFDGAAADSTDQTNTTYIATNSDLSNFTIQLTEDHSISADGSVHLPANVSPASAEVASSSGSGTLSATVVDGGINVNETGGASSATLESLNVTFNVSEDPSTEGATPDAVNSSYSNWMKNESVLIEDDDASEQHTYLVYARDKVVDVSYETVDTDIEFNETSMEVEANGSDATGQVVVTFTRENTTYEHVPLSKLHFEVALNTTVFSDINENSELNPNSFTLVDVRSEDDLKVYEFASQAPDNTTTDYSVRFNTTVETGEINESVVVTSVQDPDGGVETSADRTFAHALGGGVLAPNFFNIGDIGIIPAAIGGLVLIGVVWSLYSNRDERSGMRGYAAYTTGWMMAVWVVALAIGVTMVADFVLGSGFTLWTDLVAQMGLPDVTPLIGGIAFVGVALGLNLQE